MRESPPGLLLPIEFLTTRQIALCHFAQRFVPRAAVIECETLENRHAIAPEGKCRSTQE
jgi:hypothetical protein